MSLKTLQLIDKYIDADTRKYLQDRVAFLVRDEISGYSFLALTIHFWDGHQLEIQSLRLLCKRLMAQHINGQWFKVNLNEVSKIEKTTRLDELFASIDTNEQSQCHSAAHQAMIMMEKKRIECVRQLEVIQNDIERLSKSYGLPMNSDICFLTDFQTYSNTSNVILEMHRTKKQA